MIVQYRFSGFGAIPVDTARADARKAEADLVAAKDALYGAKKIPSIFGSRLHIVGAEAAVKNAEAKLNEARAVLADSEADAARQATTQQKIAEQSQLRKDAASSALDKAESEAARIAKEAWSKRWMILGGVGLAGLGVAIFFGMKKKGGR